MIFPNRKIVEQIKSEYPVGCRVELVSMNDIQAPPVSTQGTVICIDDAGTIFVNWDNGSNLGVVYGEDRCVKI